MWHKILHTIAVLKKKIILGFALKLSHHEMGELV